MSVTLVAVTHYGEIPGIPAVHVRDCAFMHDPTVRAWIAGRLIVLADPAWTNQGGWDSLTFSPHKSDEPLVREARLVHGLS